MGDKVVDLPVTFKSPDEGQMLVLRRGPCPHGKYLVDETAATVECALCHAKLNPIHVLSVLANRETMWHRARARYQEEMKLLTERSRTKCQHCGKLTRIRR